MHRFGILSSEMWLRDHPRQPSIKHLLVLLFLLDLIRSHTDLVCLVKT